MVISCCSYSYPSEIATSAKSGLAMTVDFWDSLWTSAAHDILIVVTFFLTK